MLTFVPSKETVFGGELTVIRPENTPKGYLYEGELSITLENTKRPPSVPGLESIRRETGFPNRNLNTIEILTDCVTLCVRERQIRLWVYYPRKPFDQTDRACVLYLHAGSWFAGSPFVCENACRYLAEAAGCAVFNLEYALAPEHPYPAPQEDCLAALEYIRTNAVHYGATADKLCLAAESCGGQILLSATQNGALCPDVKLLGLFYPCVSLNLFSAPFTWREDDFEISDAHRPYILPRLVLGRADGQGNQDLMNLIAHLYLPGVTDLSPAELSPLNGDLSTIPPLFLATAEYDGLRQQGEYFAAEVMRRGIAVTTLRYAGVHHAFLDKFGILPQGKHCMDAFAAQIKALGKG